MPNTDDDKFMQLAMHLAERGRGKVEPNPMVGAVVVHGGRIIGQGYHRSFGGPHAEINALGDCRESASGATMYVNLEPCCHQGKTPACSEALIAAGLAQVVVATKDPSAKVAGRGLEQLRKAGIGVIVGPGGTQARRLNAAFFKLNRKAKPFVLLKWAQSLDGKIATRTGQSRWISNEKSRRFSHRLRRQSQAILVGIGTVLADDPLLTPRPAIRGRLPLRIVVDSQLRLPGNCQLVRTAKDCPLLIATTQHALENHKDAAAGLSERGVELCPLSPGAGPVDLDRLLDVLADRHISNLMVEGGSQILTSFIEQHLADEICIFVSPRIIGGKDAIGPIAGSGPTSIAEALMLEHITVRRFAEDLLIRGDLPGLDYLCE